MRRVSLDSSTSFKMEIPDIPFGAVLYTWVAVVVALPMAFLVSLVLLWVYLRAVKRSMLRRAAGEPLLEPAPSAHDAAGQTVGRPERPLHVETLDAGAIRGQWTVTRRIWLAGMTYAVAGLGFAYVTATAFLLATGLGLDWQVALTGAMIYTWPIVITLGLVCSVSWLGLGLLVLGYALVLAASIAVLTAGTTITAGQVALLWFPARGNDSVGRNGEADSRIAGDGATASSGGAEEDRAQAASGREWFGPRGEGSIDCRNNEGHKFGCPPSISDGGDQVACARRGADPTTEIDSRNTARSNLRRSDHRRRGDGGVARPPHGHR